MDDNPTTGKVTVTATANDDGRDMTPEITHFAEAIGLERAAAGRYSFLLVLGLFGGFKSGLLNPAKVVHEIQALEGIGRPSQTKPPIQNKHPPLKGLWHKHYMEDGLGAMAINLRKGLARHGIPFLEEKIREAQQAGEEHYLTPEDLAAIAHDAAIGNWMRLMDAKALTGEWLLYAQHEGQNYYLCLGTHDSDTHEALRQQIDVLCCREFPFLTKLLEDA